MSCLKKLISSILIVTIFTSCASSTVIKSSVSSAKIYADGNFIGEGSGYYSDRKITGSTTVIEIKKEGYKDKVAQISRSGQLNVGALVGGILLAPSLVGLLFFLWITDYKDYYAFDLEPETATK